MNVAIQTAVAIAVLSAAAVAANADARPALSLDEATSRALTQSPLLEQTRAQASLAKWRQTESLSGFLPSVSLGGHWYFYERTPYFRAVFGQLTVDSLPPASPWLDAELQLKVPIFDGLQNVDRLDSASEQSQAADLQVDWGTFSLRQQVRLAYAAVLEARQLAVVAAQDVKDLRDHRRLIRERIRAGVTTRVDILRVDTQLSNALSEQTHADDDVKIRLRELSQVMGDGEGEGGDEGAIPERELEGELPVPSDAELRAIEAARPGARPDIEALSLEAQAATDAHRAASKWWVPDLSFVGGYDAYTSQPLKVTAYTLGVAMKINLFDGLVSYSRSKEAIESERIASRAQEASVLQAQTDFETYRRRYRYDLERYRAQIANVARAAESVRLARLGFRAGTQTNTDVLDAEQDLFNARSSRIQAQYDALESLVRFELALGRNVTP